MQPTNRRSLLRYLLPSISEFEFIFLTSLFTSTLGAVLIRYGVKIKQVVEPNAASSLPLILITTTISVFFLWVLVSMAVRAYRLPLGLDDVQDRVSYVMLPTTILMFIGMAAILKLGFSKDPNFNIVTPIMVL